MAGNSNYTVDASGVIAQLRKFQTSLPEGCEDAMNKALQDGYNTAYALCPVDTGKLRDSLTIVPAQLTPQTVKGQITAYAENTSGNDYSQYQEKGFTDRAGRWHEGRFFMLAGRNKAQQTLDAEVARQLKGRLDE